MSPASNSTPRYDGTVALWFSSHHAVHPRDWRNIDEFHGSYHPLAGYYKSDDPNVFAKHLRWMRRAGVDMIVYDAYGSNALTLHDMPNDRTLRMLTSALADQSNESCKLQLTMWLEKYADNPSLEQYQFALGYIREHLSSRDFYFHYRGKPLVVTYLNNNSPAIDELEYRNEHFELRRIRPFQSDVWSYIEHFPQMMRRTWMSACPGFDTYLEDAYLAKYVRKDPSPDFDEIRKNAFWADREDGQFFRRQLQRARDANPDIIFVSGWNDWQYGCQIEPAVEYGFKYVDMIAEVLGRWNETEPYRRQEPGPSA